MWPSRRTGAWLVTANQTSDSVSLVDLQKQKVLDEIPVGEHPAFLTLCPDGHTVLVSCEYAGTVVALNVEAGKLKVLGKIAVGFQPCGIAVAPKGTTAFVGLVATGQVAEVDWKSSRSSGDLRWGIGRGISRSLPMANASPWGWRGKRGLSCWMPAPEKNFTKTV